MVRRPHAARPRARPTTRPGSATHGRRRVLFAVNGTVSKVVLTRASRRSSWRRSAQQGGAFLCLAFLLVVAPGRLRVGRRELAAPRRLRHRRLRARAVALLRRDRAAPDRRSGCCSSSRRRCSSRSGRGSSGTSRCGDACGPRSGSCSAGLALVAEVWAGVASNASASPPALAARCALAVYFLWPARAAHRDAISLSFSAFLFAALLLGGRAAVVELSVRRRSTRRSRSRGLLGVLRARLGARHVWIVVLGTIVPFVALIGALQHLPRDDGVDRGDVRAGRRRRRRLGLARRDASRGADRRRRRRARRHPAGRDVPLT